MPNRLHAPVSTTVYDRSWKGTAEQFVLHFHKQLRLLDESTPLVRLTLLQTAVMSVPELRIVETMKNTCLSQIHTQVTILSHMINTSLCYKMRVSDMTKSLKQKPLSRARALY